MNKKTEVLNYIKKNGHITSLEAIKKFGATRLSAIIYSLRKNHIIITQKKTDVDRYGNVCQWAVYIYLGEKK